MENNMLQENLPLRERKFDIFFAIMFSLFAITSGISDAIPTLGIEMSANAPTWFGRANYDYAINCDPLFLHPPVWMRFVTGLSAFLYGPFYLLLVYALVKGKNWIQLPAVIYATMIGTITGVIVFGVEFFGEPEYRCQNVTKFLSFNTPYVLIPILLLIRMRKADPFKRKF
ncbi:MAG TPA: emopamil-binding family protein [Cytophagaceae bacterium]|nr:emopamil-binding family protein [Cytophagaceae bacterium]